MCSCFRNLKGTRSHLYWTICYIATYYISNRTMPWGTTNIFHRFYIFSSMIAFPTHLLFSFETQQLNTFVQQVLETKMSRWLVIHLVIPFQHKIRWNYSVCSLDEKRKGWIVLKVNYENDQKVGMNKVWSKVFANSKQTFH